MALKLSTALKAARLNLYSTQLGTSPVLEIYSGTQPAGPDSAATGLLLCTMICSTTFASTTTTATLTVSQIADGTGTVAATSGGTTAGWARIRTAAAGAGGLGIMDVAVGVTGSGAELIMTPDALIKTDQVISEQSLTITSGN